MFLQLCGLSCCVTLTLFYSISSSGNIEIAFLMTSCNAWATVPLHLQRDLLLLHVLKGYFSQEGSSLKRKQLIALYLFLIVSYDVLL